MSACLHALLVLAGALALDLAVGEWPARLHPVVWMGAVISWLERRAPSGRRGQLAHGALMALSVPLLFAAGAWGLCHAARGSAFLSVAVEALLLKSAFAVRALGEAAREVAAALRRGEVDAARAGLRSLCSRDPSRLEASQVAAAAVESVAENASDSAVAPLFWWALLGVPGALAYRAVNTLDARVGYRGRYEWLGKASARLDDLLNLIPARITAGLLVACGFLLGANARAGLAVLRRDGAGTESPNAGRPMAAMAGLLEVELEKEGHYRLGDPVRAVEAETIGAAWRIAFTAMLVAAAIAAAAASLGGWRGWR
jgi:adenosylcobinamide-phosphate synthase